MESLGEKFLDVDGLSGLASAFGIPDPEVLIGGDPPDPATSLEDRTLPGEGDEIELDKDKRDLLARELCEELSLYDAAMESRVARWDEIEDAYDLIPSEQSGGEVGESESISSEWLMSSVDQASARLEEAILGADPLVRARPIQGEGADAEQWAREARSTETLLNNYVRRECGFDRQLPIVCHRTTKLGSTVLRIGWRRRKWVSTYYDMNGDEEQVPQESGGIYHELIDNRQVVLWPPTLVDWQDAELVGHRARLSHHKWKIKATELGLSDEDVARVDAGDHSEARDADGQPETLDENKTPKQITELWCDRTLPGESEPQRFQVFLHEPTSTLLKIFPNRHREQQHPYFPIRYKLTDKSAWGDGLGDEALTAQSVESALRTLELDNLMAGAYWINWVRAGSMTDINLDRLRPGEVLRGDDPTEFKPMKMGGDAPEVGAAIEKNRFYGREATGLAAVLGGQGDPTMKSGAGTGSTLALIEQASTKFNAVGRRIKMDLADIFAFDLELLAQFATGGQLYKVATREDAGAIEMLRWLPPRARLRDVLHIEVEAPSAATSNAARRQSYLMLWTFSSRFVQAIVGQAGPLLQQENPQGYARWLREWASFLEQLARRIVEYHDLPGMKEMVPLMPEATPEDQIIMQLQQALQQAQAETQQVQQQFQQHLAEMQGAAQPQGPQPPQMGPPQGPPQGDPTQMMGGGGV